jgi:hypothetical protein
MPAPPAPVGESRACRGPGPTPLDGLRGAHHAGRGGALGRLDHRRVADSGLHPRARVTEQIRRTTPTASTAEIDQAVVVGLVGMAIWGLFIAMLWLTMSWANGRGAGWARIMATVLFVIGAFLAYGSYTQAAPALTKAIEALSVAIGAATMYLLYRPESSDYYRKMKAIPPA